MDKLAAALGVDPVELRSATRCDGQPTAHRSGGRRAGAGRGAARPNQTSRDERSPSPRRGEGGEGVDRGPERVPGGVSNTTHGEGVVAASATRSASRTSASPRGSTTTPRPACASRSTAGRVSRYTRPPSRSARASSPCRRRSRAPSWASSASPCSRPTRGRFGGVEVGLAPDVRDGRRGQGRVRGGPGASPRHGAG